MSAPRLSAALSMHQLRLNVHLGEHEPERSEEQAIEVSVSFYFKDLPSACGNDNGQFLCYGKITDALERLVEKQEFRLIEFLAMRMYDALRGEILTCFGKEKAEDVYVWISLHKCNLPIEQLVGGASFEYTDVPSGLL
jgi:FolB domain-containing protein